MTARERPRHGWGCPAAGKVGSIVRLIFVADLLNAVDNEVSGERVERGISKMPTLMPKEQRERLKAIEEYRRRRAQENKQEGSKNEPRTEEALQLIAKTFEAVYERIHRLEERIKRLEEEVSKPVEFELKIEKKTKV
jgi:hypothetical protein